MKIVWTAKARGDLERIHAFLRPKNPRAAREIARALFEAAAQLADAPRKGPKLQDFEPHEVRHIFVRDHEIRYQVTGDTIIILRLWHGRELR